MSAGGSRSLRRGAWLAGVVVLCVGYAAVAALAIGPRVDDGYRARYLEGRLDGPLLARPDGGPAQAIDFSRADRPPGVQEITGIAEPETWGAWSDAEPAYPVRITWTRPFEGPVCVWLLAAASPRHAGRAATLRLGGASATVVPRGPPAAWQRIELSPGAPAATLQIHPAADPRPVPDHMQWAAVDPTSVTAHRLALHRLAVVDGRCAG